MLCMIVLPTNGNSTVVYPTPTILQKTPNNHNFLSSRSFQKWTKKAPNHGASYYMRNVVSRRSIMSAILLMSGPVCTHSAMNTNGPHCLRMITSQQFVEAAQELEKADFGFMYTPQQNQRGSHVFIKRPPSDGVIASCLMTNADLCMEDEYATRYAMRPPASVIRKWREKLVSHGLVPDDHFQQ